MENGLLKQVDPGVSFLNKVAIAYLTIMLPITSERHMR